MASKVSKTKKEQYAVRRSASKQHTRRQLHNQVIRSHPDQLIHDMQMAVPGWTQSGPDVLKQQRDRLEARYLYMSERMNPRRIAEMLKLDASEVFHWIDLYGWTEMRQKLEIRRSQRYATTKAVNAFVIEQQADANMSKASQVAGDILDMHLSGEAHLDAGGLKSVVDSIKTIFEVRGAIKGSDKIGEKLKVEISGEVQHSLNEMLRHVATPKKEIPLNDRPRITIEDASRPGA